MAKRRTIFVFGSNLAGRHGAGSALEAKKKWGAKAGIGEGPTGDAYAIPTKDAALQVRNLFDIDNSVALFLQYAKQHQNCDFVVCAIGCGLAGYTPDQIGPMFRGAPANVELPDDFKPYVEEKP